MSGPYSPHADGPADDMPLCPICPAGRPYAVRVAPAGAPPGYRLECGNCLTLFAGTPGEMRHPRNVARRQVQAEYGKHQQATDDARGPMSELIARAQAIARGTR